MVGWQESLNLVAKTSVIVVAPGLDWASIMTAIGTVLVAVVAVWIALWTDRRTGVRIAAEQARHDKEIADERVLADKRLADQLSHSDAQLADERAHSAAQLQEERRLAQDREQLAEAYLVQVTAARQNALPPSPDQPARDPAEPVEHAVAIVVNHGRYTITRVEAQICLSRNSLTGYGRTERVSSYFNLREELTEGMVWEARASNLGTLTPMDLGLRYTTDLMATKFLVGSYPMVRWTDRWGQRWEHKQGVVRKISEGEAWAP